MSYKELMFSGIPMETVEVLIAQLADLQYEGFEETENGLKAYIQDDIFNKEAVDRLSEQLQVNYSLSLLPDRNWNQEWESNFDPVIVEGFCAIRADFHQPVNNVQHEILITPKMSFGTGHHPTTYMMIQQMKEMDFNNKSVLDFGTGTGVLAILAAKLGSKNVLAIDNDEWSISNAGENIVKNNVSLVELVKADTGASDKKFDIILANITRNVILDNFKFFDSSITQNGTLVLSGLLPDDEPVILNQAIMHKFTLTTRIQRDNWISLRFMKKTK